VRGTGGATAAPARCVIPCACARPVPPPPPLLGPACVRMRAATRLFARSSRPARSCKDAGAGRGGLRPPEARAPCACVSSALDAARAFFALPLEEKMRVQAPTGAGNACLRGYVPYGSQLQRSADVDGKPSSAAGRTPDRKESFTVGVHSFCDRETRSAEAGDEAYFAKESADGRLFAANQWPLGPAGAEVRARVHVH